MDEINDQLHSFENTETNSSVDSLKVDGVIIQTNSQHDRLQNTLNNDSLTKIDDCEIEEKSTSSKLIEQKETENNETKDNNKIKACDSLTLSKQNIANSTVLNILKTQIVSPTQKKNVPLNLEKIAIPKTNTLDIKLSSPITFDQTKVTPSILTISPTNVKPITTATKPLPTLNTSEINCDKIISNQIQGIKITSSKDSSNVVLVPHNGVNYIIKNPNESAEQKNQLLLTQVTDAKKISTFVTRMQKLPDGKYKMLAPAGDLPVGLETLFNQNSHFVKQKKNTDSTENEHKVSYFLKSPPVDFDSKETNHFQNDSEVLLDKVNCTESTLVSSNNEETNHDETKLQDSYKEVNCMETSSVSSNNEETDHSETKLQDSYKETEFTKTSSINSMTIKTKNNKKMRRVSCQKTNRIYTSSVNSRGDRASRIQKKLKLTSEQMNRIGTPLVDPNILIRIKREAPPSPEYSYTDNMKTSYMDSFTEETDNAQIETQETNAMEMSSINFGADEMNYSERKLRESDEKRHSIDMEFVNNISEEASHVENNFQEMHSIETPSVPFTSEKLKTIHQESHLSSKETNGMGSSSVNSINEKTNNIENDLEESSEEISRMETSSVISISEESNDNENDLEKLSEEISCIETSSVISISEESNDNENDLEKLSEEISCVETSSVISINEESNDNENDLEKLSEEISCIETSSVISIDEESNDNENDLEKLSEEISCIETSSVISIDEESNNNENDLEKLSEEISSIKTSLVNSIDEKANNSKNDLEESFEKNSSMKKSFVNSINKEANNSEDDLKESSEEISCMETSPVNFTTKKNYTIKKESQESCQETNRIVSSPVNSFVGKTYRNLKKLPIISEQIKCVGTPVVDPDILRRINIEKSTNENNLLNTIFKAPDIKSYQRHKFIVSRSTADKRYAMKNINDAIDKVKMKTIGNQKLCASPRSFVQFLPKKSQPTIQTNNQPLIIRKYDSISNTKTNLNPNFKSSGKKVLVKILKSDGEKFGRIIPPEEIKKLFPGVIHSSKVTQIEENSRKNKISPTEEIQTQKRMKVSNKEDGRKFITCKNKYCTSLTHDIIRPELIDNLYCSLACKMLDSKQMGTENKSDVQIKEEPQNKPAIDRKKLLEKLKNRINKRKQSLPSCYTEKVARKVHCGEPKIIEIPCTKPSTKIQPVIQKPSPDSSCQIIPRSVEDLERSKIKKRKSKVSTDLTTKDIQVNNEITSKYLKKFTPAPKKLFDTPFPSEKNCFNVGQKLEGIDPTHEALFCVLTVVEVCGYRIKLHFDGYPANYDFWVNADNPDLFYANWCQEHNRPLQLPRGYKKKFDWDEYFEENAGAIPAPKINFISTKHLDNVYTHLFHVGRKLEALDKMTRTLSKQLICVATVADVLANRIRIHFDGWSNDFDYWADITSTNLHPIGWCDKNGRNVCPPNGYDDKKKKKPFMWAQYLQETNSKPVSEDAFVRRPLREFSFNMAIEVVDLVVPSLIRVAKVVDVKGNELKILYDGFDSKYAYWIDDDSPDIHPLGWCIKTNHPLEIPSGELLPCKVAGCNGKGNSNSLKINHFFFKDCPYDFVKWGQVISGLPSIPDRLTLKDIPVKTKQPRKKYLREKKNTISQPKPNPSKDLLIDPRKKIIQKQKEKIMKLQKQGLIKIQKQEKIPKKPKKKVIKGKLKKRRLPMIKGNEMMKNRVDALFKVMTDIENLAGKSREQNMYRPRFDLKGRVWPHYPILKLPDAVHDVRQWSTEEVGYFVDKLISLNSTYRSPEDEVLYADRFIQKKIDGKTFLNLSQDYFTKSMKIPLGTALKISNGIKRLRRQFPDLIFKDESYR